MAEDDVPLVFPGESLEPGCDIDIISDCSRIHPFLGSDGSHDDISIIDSDSDADVFSDHRYLESLDEILNLQSTHERLIGIIMLEDDHRAVSEEFIDVSALLVDDLADSVEIDIEEE